MRHVFLTALMVVCFDGAAPTDKPVPDDNLAHNYSLSFTPVRMMGDKVAGDIHCAF
jgi:hypothetical protein